MSQSSDNKQMTIDYRALFANEIETLMQKINSVDAKILRSQMEVDKLSKKNTLANSNIEKIQTIMDRASKDQIMQVYQNALDVNQRFMTMRSQVDKLESEKVVLESEIVLLEKLRSGFDNLLGDLESVSANSTSTLETIIQSQESERLALARQMHDGPAQQLSNFILQTEIAIRFFSMDAEKAEVELQELKKTATKTFEAVRDFIFRLRPMMLDDLGLLPTMKRFVGVMNDKSDEKIVLEFTGTDQRYKTYIEIMVFRAIQELLENSIKLSNASEIKVMLDLSKDRIGVQVQDDGAGFSLDSLDEESSVGMKVLQDRIRLMQGELEIDSEVGKGSSVSFYLPA